jgi:hypothetical protein
MSLIYSMLMSVDGHLEAEDVASAGPLPMRSCIPTSSDGSNKIAVAVDFRFSERLSDNRAMS